MTNTFYELNTLNRNLDHVSQLENSILTLSGNESFFFLLKFKVLFSSMTTVYSSQFLTTFYGVS